MADDSDSTAGPADRSLEADLRHLVAEARAFAQAEIAFQKARAGLVGKESGRVALLAVAAGVFAFFALVGLTVGAVIGLTPWLGALGATAVVAGTLLALALVCVGLAIGRVKRIGRALSGEEEG